MKKQISIFSLALFLLACNMSTKDNKTNGSASTKAIPTKKVERYGMVTGLKPEQMETYKKLHAAVWPGVLKKLSECNITNYSIYLKEIDGKPYLFSYWEYTGDNFDADMKKMAADSTTQRWWKETAPLQIPVTKDATAVSAWSRMDEVFHHN